MDAMYCERKITGDTIYVGASDRRLSLFENVFPLDNGVSYNAYLVLDEKTVLMDTVDRSVSGSFTKISPMRWPGAASTTSLSTTWSRTTAPASRS